MNINRTNTFTQANSLNNIQNISSEGIINQQKTVFKHNKNISNKIKLKNFFINFGNFGSNNGELPNPKNTNDIQSSKNFSKSINENFKSCFFKNDNDKDEQSYAFQNLVNLNKDKSMNEKIIRDGFVIGR